MAAPTGRALIQQVLQASGDTPLTPRDVLERIEILGWTTNSKDPLNVVRTQLGQLRERIPNVQEERSGSHVRYTWRDKPQLRLGPIRARPSNVG